MAAELHIIIIGVTIANHGRLQETLDSISNKKCFSLFIFEIDFLLTLTTINFCLLILEFKLDAKEGTANGRTH